MLQAVSGLGMQASQQEARWGPPHGRRWFAGFPDLAAGIVPVHLCCSAGFGECSLWHFIPLLLLPLPACRLWVFLSDIAKLCEVRTIMQSCVSYAHNYAWCWRPTSPSTMTHFRLSAAAADYNYNVFFAWQRLSNFGEIWQGKDLHIHA